VEHQVFVKNSLSGFHTRLNVKGYIPEFLQWLGFKPRDLPVVIIDTDYANWTIGAFCDESPYWFSETQMFVQVKDSSKVMNKDQPLSKMIMDKVKMVKEQYNVKPNFYVLKSDEKSCEPFYEKFYKEKVIPDYLDSQPKQLLTVNI
jgi:hypothetical protein